MIRIELKGNKWAVTKFVKEHNLTLENSDKVHSLRPHRHFTNSGKNFAEAYQASIMVPSGVMYDTMDGNHASQISFEAHRISRTMSPVESSHQIKGDLTV